MSFIYKDIDISMSKNIYNDVSVLTDKASIINTFKNNLFIDTDEKYFDNSEYSTLKSALHKQWTAVTEEFVEETILKAVQKDDRIDKLLNLSYSFDDRNYTLYIEVHLRLNLIINQNADRDINFTLVVRKD